VGNLPIIKVELHSVAAEDGQVRRDGNISTQPLVGDTQGGLTIQAFFSFDMSSIPKGAAIRSASLYLPATDTFGSPFEVLGRLYLYECSYSQLQPKDFITGPQMPGALYSTISLFNDSVTSDLFVNAIQTTVNNGDSRFQIRLQFEKQQAYRSSGYSPSTYNNLADYIAFSVDRTTLTIEYQY
jgi:hypothetical protein